MSGNLDGYVFGYSEVISHFLKNFFVLKIRVNFHYSGELYLVDSFAFELHQSFHSILMFFGKFSRNFCHGVFALHADFSWFIYIADIKSALSASFILRKWAFIAVT